MWLFVFAALITLAVVALLVWPLLKPRAAPAPASGFNTAVYADQLGELDRDLARGVIGEAEAGAARAEIERRLLAAADAKAPAPASAPAPKVVAFALAAGIAVSGGALYLGLGAPQAATGTAERTATDDPMHAEMAKLVAQLEQKMRENPTDPNGWALLARSQIRLNRAAEAVESYARALALTGGGDAQLKAEYAEARVIAAGGAVDAQAQAVFAELLAADARDPQARFYLALARAQAGDVAGALNDWRALMADTPQDAPWRETLAQQIAQAEGQAPAPSRGPSPEQAQAAQALAPDAQAQMIEGMVASLAERLKQSPDDLEGWRRLSRSYDVLNRPAEAEGAYREVLRLAPNDPDALWRLGELAAVRRDFAAARRYWTTLDEALPRGSTQKSAVRERLAGLPGG